MSTDHRSTGDLAADGTGHPLGDALPPWFPKAILYVAIGFGGFLLAKGLIVRLQSLFITLLLALFLSFAMEPAVDFLVDRGWRRGRATGLVFVVTIVGGSIFTWVMVDLFVSEASKLVRDAPGYVRDLTDWINRRFDTELTTDSLIDQIEQYQGDISRLATNMGGRVLSVSAQVVGGLFQVLTILLFTFYMVADGPRLRRTICSALPAEKQRLVIALWELAIRKTGGYLYSRLLLAAIASTTASIVFALSGVPYPLALAIWLGLLSQFVPVIGTYLAGALPLVIALLNNPVSALAVLIYMVVYQQVENYILAPRVTAKTMDIHPAVAFGSVIAGSGILGGVGALLALPAAAIIQATVSSFLHRHELIESELMADTGPGPIDDAGGKNAGGKNHRAADPGRPTAETLKESWTERISRRLERPGTTDGSGNRGWQGVEEDP